MNFLKKYDRKSKCPICGGKKKIGLRFKFSGRIGFYYFAKCRKCRISVSDKRETLNIQFLVLALTLIIVGFSFIIPTLYMKESTNDFLLIGCILGILFFFLMVSILIKRVQSKYVEKRLDELICVKNRGL